MNGLLVRWLRQWSLAARGRCLLGCSFGSSGPPRAPDVVALRSDASKDGLGRDGRRDRVLHAELKLFAENPALRARARRESCTAPVEAHCEQFLRAALEEIRGLGIVVRCRVHRSLSDGPEARKAHLGRRERIRQVGLPARSAIVDALGQRLVDLLDCQEGCRLGSYEARSRHGQRERRSSDIVRQINDDDHVVLSEAIVGCVKFAAERFDGARDRCPSSRRFVLRPPGEGPRRRRVGHCAS